MAAQTLTEDIAIVGMGLVVAGADTPEAFWARLLEGADPFRVPPPGRWNTASFESADPRVDDKTYCSTIGLVDEASQTPDGRDFTVSWLRRSIQAALSRVRVAPSDRFRYTLGYSPDTAQALETALVVDDVISSLSDAAALAAPGSAGRLRSLIADTVRALWPRGARNPAELVPHKVLADSAQGLLPGGTPAVVVDTACASGLHSVDLGVKSLLADQCDIAVCAGASSIGPLVPVLFGRLGGLPRTGRCRPLDASSEGVMFADGAAVIVLKRIARARADGDRVLAVIKAFGTSSDGKGKAIYAPSSVGQIRAITSCQEHPAFDPERLVWVVAHATGTAAGDVAELQALGRRTAGRCLVTSNKAVVGHTGWAAGVVSIIHAVLGITHGLVPPQPRYTGARPEAGLGATGLIVPTAAAPLPRPDGGPPQVAVSAFGFGGINGHLLLAADAPVDTPPPPPRPSRARIVIVAWAAHVPGLADVPSQIAWLSGRSRAPEASFGPTYPDPGERLRLAGRTKRAIDRTQLMALECLPRLAAQLGSLWPEVAAQTGVFLGHFAKTSHGVAYGRRVHLDEIREQLTRAWQGKEPLLLTLLERYGEQVRASVPPSSEDSFPGLMPNVIAARLANVYDLHGPTMALDAGFASTQAALEAACQYLRLGGVDCAIAGAINGNSLPEAQRLLQQLTARSDLVAAEGAFLFALVREETAVAAGLTPLAYFDDLTTEPQPDAPAAPGLHYLGAQGAVELARALVQIRAAGELARPVCVRDTDEHGVVRRSLTLTPYPERPAAAEIAGSGSAPKEPAGRVQRYVAELRPIADEPQPGACPFFGVRDGATVVLTDRPELASALLREAGRREKVVIVSTVPGAGVLHVPVPDEASLDSISAALSAEVVHIRLVSDLTGSDPGELAQTAIALHDLLFLALRRFFRQLEQRSGSVGGLLLGGVREGRPHPCAALHAGLLSSAAQELARETPVFCVATDQTDLRAALAEADAERGLARMQPMVYRVRGQRHAELPRRAEVPPRGAVPPLTSESTVVLIGGARGITAELARALAGRFRPRLYLLGRQPLRQPSVPSRAGAQEGLLDDRPAFIARALAATPGRPVRDILAEHERLYLAREAERNLRALELLAGSERVRYLRCDVKQAESVDAAVATILAEAGAIDLLLFGAGIDESQGILQKTLASFRAVRDVKLLGYQNLKRALRDRPPRRWVNIGSLTGVFGNHGQTDYAAGNAYLAAAARLSPSHSEVTLAFSLWADAGFVTHPQRRELVKILEERFTPMPAAEGARHFLAELESSGPSSVVTWMGPAERTWVRGELRAAPDFLLRSFPELRPESLEGAPPECGGFFLDTCLERTPDRCVFSRVFDLERDAYLREHVVSGHPTLPGTFVLEIAAEAAAALAPGQHLIGFQDVSFEQFLRLSRAERPVEVRILAERVPPSRSAETHVRVRIVSDVIAPSGVLLKRDRLHFSLTVRLSAAPAAAPRDPAGSGAHAAGDPLTATVDPYQLDGSPVRLTGVFATLADTESGERLRRARYVPTVATDHVVFRAFRVPVLLLDGMLRVSVLRTGQELVVAAPRRIGSVELFEPCSDAALGLPGTSLRITSVGAPSDEGGSVGGRQEARRGDGRLIARIEGLECVKLGTVPAPAPQPARVDEEERSTRLSAAYAAYLESITPAAPIESFPELLEARNGPRRAFRSASFNCYFLPTSDPRGARIEVEGRRMLPLGSYSYLGLIGHPAIDAAAKAAIDRFGTGTHGVRALAGTLTLHQELERRIAAFKGKEDAIAFTSGFTTNVATIAALVGQGDWVICDTLDHASIVDGAQLSGARFVQFQHNSLSSLELRLKHCAGGRRLVVADAVFSMDGDIIDLPAVAALCKRYDAWLMIDEAHSTGVLGQRGHGILEHFGMPAGSVEILMGTLSKAIPSVGGYVAASAEIVDFLRNHARPFVFSAALPPPQAAAALAALDVIEAEPERVTRLWANTRRYQTGLTQLGFNTLGSCTPIVPIVGGSAATTLEMARLCHEAGIFVPPVVYPVVPIRTPRLRSNMSAAYADADVDYALSTLAQIGRRLGVIPPAAPARLPDTAPALRRNETPMSAENKSSGESLTTSQPDFDAVIVGAGVSGLYMLHRLRTQGLRVRLFEAGGGVGGTWYWNRYPGARCDIESTDYAYSFSEELLKEWTWSERYASQPEILRYLNHVADRFNLRPDIQLETRVTSAAFDEATGRWQIRTDRGDTVSAQFCIMALGNLSAENVPAFEGLSSFQGRWYHTGRWPEEAVDFSGQRVAVIGTGSSGVQVIPKVAAQAAHLFVFQRTPNFVSPARNATLSAEQARDMKAGGIERLRKARETEFGVVLDGDPRSALEVSNEERQRIYDGLWEHGGLGFYGAFSDLLISSGASETAAEFFRAKIRAIVRSPEVAERLTPRGYYFATKRLCLGTQYYETFNRPNVTLVDVRRDPITSITPTGLRTRAGDYALDSIVFATGFDAVTGTMLKIDVRGRHGLPLKQKWADGPRAYLGLLISGFPNLFVLGGPTTPTALSNEICALEQHVEWSADCIEYLRKRQLRCIEATAEAEDRWQAHVAEVAQQTLLPTADSWYMGANIPGKPRVFMAYAAGVGAHGQRCSEVAASGYDGCTLT